MDSFNEIFKNLRMSKRDKKTVKKEDEFGKDEAKMEVNDSKSYRIRQSYADERDQIEVWEEIGQTFYEKKQIEYKMLEKSHQIQSPCDKDKFSAMLIFKLDIDCLEEIFDWLSLNELYALSQTCRRLQRVSGFYFQQNFPTIEVHCEDDGISVLNRSIRIDGFSQFTVNLSIYGDLNRYRYVAVNCKSLKKIEFLGSTLSSAKIECIEEILSKVETIKIRSGQINANFYENFLKFCPNLRRLSIKNFRIYSKSKNGNDWLHQKYPNLVDFELLGDVNIKIDDLIAFFNQNPNIRRFSTDANYFLIREFEKLCTEAKVSLDDLIIVRDYNEDELKQSICGVLNSLFEKGLYKRLHLHGTTAYFFQEVIDEIGSLRALTSLRCGCFLSPIPSVNLSVLTSLRELSVHYYPQSGEDMLNMARSLYNLEKVSFAQATVEDILPFVFYSTQIREIRVQHIMNSSHLGMGEESKKKNYFNGNILYLKALNRRRGQLNGARSVTMFVSENVYLATKWANETIDCELIRLKRA